MKDVGGAVLAGAVLAGSSPPYLECFFLFFFFLSDREPHCHLDAEGGEGWETGRLWEVAAERASVCMRRRMM